LDDGEDLEELEREWNGGEELGFYGKAAGSFIELGEVQIGISPVAGVQMRRRW
jgi:hypothetical protein